MILWQLYNSNLVKTPTVLQMETVECGVAVLKIILDYYGKIVPLAELRQEFSISRDGIKVSDLLQMSRYYGLEAKSLAKESKELLKIKPPFVVPWKVNHYLVVEGFDRGKVYINDSATGPRFLSWQKFNEGYAGTILVLRPNEEFTKDGKKLGIIRSLWLRLRNEKTALMYCIVAGFFLSLVNLLVPFFSQIFIDEILVKGQQKWLPSLLLGMVVIAAFQGGLTWLRMRYLRRLKIKLSISLSSHFIWHILRLSISFYSHRSAGEISHRSQLNDRVAEILSGQLASSVIDSVMVLLYLGVMLQYDLVLTSIVIGFAAINIFALQWLARKRVDANQRLILEYGNAAGASIAALRSIETLKASGLESNFFARWAGYYAKAANSEQELEVTNQTLGVLPVLLSSLSSMLLLVIGGLRVMDGYLSIGMLVAFQSMMQNFQQPISSLVKFGSVLQELEGSMIRLDDVLRNPIDSQIRLKVLEKSKKENCYGSLSKLQGYIELRNLTFGYSSLKSPLIKNFNLKIKPGERIAIVGSSGSGKSTIAKLIGGLYQPWSGEILFDDQFREQISFQVLTNSISMVEQNILLFGETVRENLTLWDTTVSEESLRLACQDAMIEDVIYSMAKGYDAQLLEEAANLSGGQRQRLEIARALVNNPSIFIMDEATSALDAKTEEIIDRNLRRRGCTCLIIAHRLSTIRDCDQIVVLDKGKVIQQGIHAELCQVEGAYSRLIKNVA